MVWQWSPSCFNIIPQNISLDELIPGCFFSTSIQPLLNGVQVTGRTGSQGHFLGSPKMEVQLFSGFCFDNFHGTFLSSVQELWSFYDLAWCFHSEQCLCCKEICALFLCKNQHILLHQFPGCSQRLIDCRSWWKAKMWDVITLSQIFSMTVSNPRWTYHNQGLGFEIAEKPSSRKYKTCCKYFTMFDDF